MTWMSQMPEIPDLSRASFEAQVDRLLEDAVRSVDWSSARWAPACNVYEDDTEYGIEVALPGMDSGCFEVTVDRTTLYLKGECKCDVPEGRTWYHREVPEGAFACSIELPRHVDTSRSTAAFRHGLLSIRFSKREDALSRRILIEGG